MAKNGRSANRIIERRQPTTYAVLTPLSLQLSKLLDLAAGMLKGVYPLSTLVTSPSADVAMTGWTPISLIDATKLQSSNTLARSQFVGYSCLINSLSVLRARNSSRPQNRLGSAPLE